ncbi:MAG: hypothetical protein ACJARX_002232 [Psychroserpens sp.]|jgi:hypothetical protein
MLMNVEVFFSLQTREQSKYYREGSIDDFNYYELLLSYK